MKAAGCCSSSARRAGRWRACGNSPAARSRRASFPKRALVRELREELGIDIAPADLAPACFASAPNGSRHMILLLYLCRRWRGEPRPLDASALRWEAPAAMRALAMPPADAPLVDLLEALL